VSIVVATGVREMPSDTVVRARIDAVTKEKATEALAK
jgi:hypothetical protein